MGQEHDKSQLIAWQDVPAALGLLSRLPVPVDAEKATARGAQAAWAYPIAGLVLALIAATLGQFALWLGIPAPLVAGLVLASLIIMTGAMHEDGLADAADGLWGGWEKERRLEIMKDSHIGAYGVIALVLGLGLRWQALSIAIEADWLWPALIGVAILSRAVMVPLMSLLSNARDGGLSRSVGRPSTKTVLVASGVAAMGALLTLQLAGLVIILIAALSATVCASIARAKIGGQTGDILGATQQITEIALLLTLAVVLTT